MQFFKIFLEKIKKHTSNIIKIILKLVDDIVKKTFNIDVNNFYPLYTCYIFNFMINPRIMDYYELPSNYSSIRNINRIIRVI